MRRNVMLDGDIMKMEITIILKRNKILKKVSLYPLAMEMIRRIEIIFYTMVLLKMMKL